MLRACFLPALLSLWRGPSRPVPPLMSLSSYVWNSALPLSLSLHSSYSLCLFNPVHSSDPRTSLPEKATWLSSPLPSAPYRSPCIGRPGLKKANSLWGFPSLCPGLEILDYLADYLPFPALSETPEPRFWYDSSPSLCFPSVGSRDPVGSKSLSVPP